MLQQEDWMQRTYIGYLDDNPKKQMLLDFVRLMKQAKQKMN
jgi:hypothetical protein